MSANTLIIICIFFAFVCMFPKRTIINPATMFFVLWGIVVYLGSIQLFGLKSVSSDTYRLIGIGLIMFGIGFLIKTLLTKDVQISLISKHQSSVVVMRRNVVYLFCYIAIVYNLYTLISVSGLLLGSGGDLGAVRGMIQSSDSVSSGGFLNIVKQFIARPVANAVPAVFAVDIFFGARDRKLGILTGIILITGLLSTGGRSQIVAFTLDLIICFTISRSNKSIENIVKKAIKTQKLKFLVGLVVLSVVLFLATKSRSGNAMYRQLYYYFSMPPIMFDGWRSIIDTSGLHGFGMSVTNGFLFILFWLCHNVLRFPYPVSWYSIYTMILNTESIWMVIGSAGIQANAYVSIFWYFYLDGRELGIIFGMLIFGYIIASYFLNAMRGQDPRKIVLFCLLYFGLFQSFARFPFSNIYFAAAWLLVVCVFYQRKPLRQERTYSERHRDVNIQ